MSKYTCASVCTNRNGLSAVVSLMICRAFSGTMLECLGKLCVMRCSAGLYEMAQNTLVNLLSFLWTCHGYLLSK